MLQELHQLERTPTPDVMRRVQDLAEFWKQKVTSVADQIQEEVAQKLQAPGSAVVGEVVEEEAPPVRPAAGSCASRLPHAAQRWVYIFMGRMLHTLGRYDKWQIIPFLKGRGGSGKSTIAQVVKNFFEAVDVGILSNNSEKKFGLQALLDKFVWLCLELKRNVQLDQAEFQSMVSGEDLCVAVKNQVARQVKWSAPGLLCGNESPGWIDAQGSIARRMALLSFPFGLQEKDVKPNLLQLILEDELAKLIVKCNLAYRAECERHSNDDIWKILPKYFKAERLNFQIETDAVYAAVNDKQRFELWKDTENNPAEKSSYYVAISVVEEHYRCKWRDIQGNGFAEPFWPQKYASAFAEAGIEGPIHGRRRDPRDVNGQEIGNMWLEGIRERFFNPP
jgi:hypothetical protein